MNFKRIRLVVLFTITIFITSCSSDDNGDNPNQSKNEVTFNGTTYDITTAWINDENTTTNDPSDIGISLFNKTTSEINSGNDLTNITFIYFDFTEVDLQEKTYTEIWDYDFSINGTLISGEFTPGTVFLSDGDSNLDIYASSSTVTINNLTDTTVDLTFSFTRKDGKVISGNYSGNYIDPN
ncbi:hypothetical protein [Aestuariibaculum sediminum]|uniref:Lipoprotein n=1 Tax=Aestuariibaculum sediminum TaxID=2770637 RepID=A0A8J6UFT1_9FLAO|nr:hypothetical protein [Aestuariibaculum sediminum]MBD0831646.1 hypothetical protein [Aestuariibaculum sediminum]